MILAEVFSWMKNFDAFHIIEVGGLLLVLAIIYTETGFFLGFVLPGGDYLLFATGIFCGTEYIDITLAVIILLLVPASFAGDYTGYYKGKWLGGKLFTDNKSRFFKLEYLERGKKFYHRFGVWAFIIGHFVPVVRSLIPMIAGATHFSMRKFLLFNAIGSIIWVCSLVPLGYYVGKTYPGIINYSGYIILFFVVIASFPMIRILFYKRKVKN